ncbi:MAG: hypothetical protein HYT99_02765, partial [Candidatus Tectomicrobia bacterium]|nr:hypothetical protein [Candidatus Tectomicrobia bacterium]
MTTAAAKKTAIFVPGSKPHVVPFMRDVFTIPPNPREKPRLIGSQCKECEEYFFPKTGAKATCDNPFCPRSTSEVLLSGRGRLLSATVTRSHEGQERASAVILLEEGIKINSALVDWEGFRDLLVPGTPVELVLQEMEVRETGETVVGYAFRMVTGRRKPKFLPPPAPPAPPAARKGAAPKPAAPAPKPPAPPAAPALKKAAPAAAGVKKAVPKPLPKKTTPKPLPKKAAPKAQPKKKVPTKGTAKGTAKKAAKKAPER